jgi:hypothetical protein
MIVERVFRPMYHLGAGIGLCRLLVTATEWKLPTESSPCRITLDTSR